MVKKVAIGEVVCNICGDKYYYRGNFNEQVAKSKDNLDFPQNWVYEINLNDQGYGSFLDMAKTQIHICDDCMYDLFENMAVKPIEKDNYGKRRWGE